MRPDLMYVMSLREYATCFLIAVAIGVASKMVWDRMRWGTDPYVMKLIARDRRLTILNADLENAMDRECDYADMLLVDPEFYWAQRQAHIAREPRPVSLDVKA